jgi:hypothetical protein
MNLMAGQNFRGQNLLENRNLVDRRVDVMLRLKLSILIEDILLCFLSDNFHTIYSSNTAYIEFCISCVRRLYFMKYCQLKLSLKSLCIFGCQVSVMA